MNYLYIYGFFTDTRKLGLQILPLMRVYYGLLCIELCSSTTHQRGLEVPNPPAEENQQLSAHLGMAQPQVHYALS